jgi:hypothetical protein
MSHASSQNDGFYLLDDFVCRAVPSSIPPQPAVTKAQIANVSTLDACILDGREIDVEKAIAIRDARLPRQPYPSFRCRICGKSVRPHKEGSTGQRAHFEHHPANPDCPLSNGTQSGLR